jgi:precorrin-6Y C5,15-methyltransferase (decarboxylating)
MCEKVYLVGVGMGGAETLTGAAAAAIAESQLLIGASRLLAPYPQKQQAVLIYPEEIAACIRETDAPVVSVLLSGDTGFFSGATKLWAALPEDCTVEGIPGISSLSYFCSKIHIPWQDMKILSAHGRDHNAIGEIQRSPRTFLLTGGKTKVQDICRALAQRDCGDVYIHVGENLSYPNERIVSGTAGELMETAFGDLAVMVVENPHPITRTYAAPGIPDEAFIRGKVPMTKEEVRVLALSKLRLEPWQRLWDVGAGTGSVSVECALALSAGQVFAIERHQEALDLIAQNKAAFGLSNLQIVPGLAPAALTDLPAPDRVFLGGTAGNLEEILRLILEKNDRCRIVCAAVTIETLSESVRAFEACGLRDVDVTQVAITKTRTVGRYHMMNAANPVWLITGEGAGS